MPLVFEGLKGTSLKLVRASILVYAFVSWIGIGDPEMDLMAGSICAARRDSVKPVTRSIMVSYREKGMYRRFKPLILPSRKAPAANGVALRKCVHSSKGK